VSASDKPSWDIVEASFLAAAQQFDQLPAQMGVELAFAGRSNVGKSSLMNALMSRKNLVRTSGTPGCTRGVNFFAATARDGAVFRLVDLPGYGYAKRSKAERAEWADLIEAYLLERDWLRAVVVLVDARRGVEREDVSLVELLATRRGPNKVQTILVATKIDKVQKSKRKAAVDALRRRTSGRIVAVSALTGEGLDRLWSELRRAAHIGDPAGEEAPQLPRTS
jgi:GTP-binding protein